MASLLQYSYSFLHKPDSVNQVGTLKYFREKYNRKNVTPSNSFEGSEELFLGIGRAYIIAAALIFFGMSDIDDSPTIHQFPDNISRDSMSSKKEYFDDVFGKFVDQFLLQKVDVDSNDDDYVKNYALCFIFLAVFIMQMKDTAAGDGQRNLIDQKLLLSVFKAMGPYSKYAIEMFISIAQIEFLLTPRLSEEFKWVFFLNWRGGSGHNIEDDLAQEISNRLGKNIVQQMGPNKSISSISKVCKASNGIHLLIQQFDDSLNIHAKSVQHTIRESLKDEKDMVAEIVQLDLFNYVQGRHHDSFPGIRKSPLKYLDIVEFHQWLNKHITELPN